MGCRVKASKAEMLRVVGVHVVGVHVVGDGDQGKSSLAPDPLGRLPGRGANVHLDLRCLDLAEKRRAFPRALRLAGPLDVGPVREHLERHLHDEHSHPPSDESGSTA